MNTAAVEAYTEKLAKGCPTCNKGLPNCRCTREIYRQNQEQESQAANASSVNTVHGVYILKFEIATMT